MKKGGVIIDSEKEKDQLAIPTGISEVASLSAEEWKEAEKNFVKYVVERQKKVAEIKKSKSL